MSLGRLTLAVAAGLVLASLPFVHYMHLGGPAEAHRDHEPRHGGQLGMVGEHHIEVVRRRGRVEVFVSDARRRALRPQSGRALFDGANDTPLELDNHRLVGPDDGRARVIEAIVVLDDGTRLAQSFDFEPPG